jgi:sulfur carrier protein ThiS
MRWVLVVLAALCLLFAAPAFAQSIPSPPTAKPSAADAATAKRNFESGLKLYGEGSYPEALIAFEQSYRLGGRPSALKNIAQCHRNLKHFVEAYEAYDQMLALHEAELSAADKTAVKQALEELGLLTGTLLVTVNETGADIEIDGKSVGASPMQKPKRVSVADHQVRVTKATFAPFEETVRVGSQEQKSVTVTLAVEKLAGHVVVREQNGREVHVFVDGQDKGPSPWEGDLDAGPHTIEAKGPRFASEARKIQLAAKERLDVALDATPLQGHLRVTTVPATATIAVDGKIVGAGSWDGDVSEGPHRIEVSLGSAPPQVRDVVIGRGQFVAQEIPIVAAIVSGHVTDFVGMYVRVALSASLGVGNQPDNSGMSVMQNGGPDLSFGASVRVGRSWDWWGAELVGQFMFEHRERDYTANLPATTGSNSFTFKDQSDGANFFLGVGPRVTSKDESVRFTFGIAPGVAVRSFNPRRSPDGGGGDLSPNNPSSSNRFVQTSQTSQSGPSGPTDYTQDFNGAGYTAFGFVMDGGILIGSTPGPKFFLGMQASLDFAPKLVTGPDTNTPIPDTSFKEPGRGISLVDGTQFFFGPVLGVQFGH